MAKVAVVDGKVLYRKMLKSCELPVKDIVWAYLQKEDVNATLCCGRMNMEIGRVIVRDKDGRSEIFQFESMEEARELLTKLQEANPDMAVGYTKENVERFEA